MDGLNVITAEERDRGDRAVKAWARALLSGDREFADQIRRACPDVFPPYLFREDTTDDVTDKREADR